MKKGIKICLSLAGVLFALGVVLFLTGSALGGRRESTQYFEERWGDLSRNRAWGPILVNSNGVHIGGENGIHVDSEGVDIGGANGIHVGHNSGNPNSEKKQLVQSGELTGITSVEAELSWGDLWIQEGEDFALSLEWNQSGYAMSYQVENGVLRVKDEDGRHKIGDNFTIACKMILTVPAGTELDTLDLSTDMGDIQIDAALTAGEADLSTDLGDVNCRGLLAREMEVQSDLGDVSVTVPSDCEGLSYSLSADLGEVLLNGQTQTNPTHVTAEKENYFLEASSSLGNVSLRLP